MKVAALLQSLALDVHCSGNAEAEVRHGTVGDLLSFVMGRCPEQAVWVTIQNHVNVAAVAVLREIPLIILSDGRQPVPELTRRCGDEKIALASSPMSAYEICGRLYALGLKG
ncbi:MAG: serine kinase [Synergistales bacterium]|nr:serine kinase [Synergistales bacterium]